MRGVLAGIGVSIVCLFGVEAPASAVVNWTQQTSNTSATITALDYRGGTTLFYGTDDGKIFQLGDSNPKLSVPGAVINDLEFNAAGTTALAAMSDGQLYRSINSGLGWVQVALTNSSWTFTTCASTPQTAVGPYTPTTGDDLLAVSWADATTAYVVGTKNGMVLKSTNVPTAATFSDASRQSNQTCRLKADITDAAAFSATGAYFLDDFFAGLWSTSDALASTATLRPAQLANCFDLRGRLAVDVANPNLAVGVMPCSGGFNSAVTTDAGATRSFLTYANPPAGGPPALYGVATTGGTTLAVGDAGFIGVLNGTGTTSLNNQPAGGSLAATGWRAVDMTSATHAAVGGAGGALAESTNANDTSPPAAAPTPQPTGTGTATKKRCKKKKKHRSASAAKKKKCKKKRR